MTGTEGVLSPEQREAIRRRVASNWWGCTVDVPGKDGADLLAEVERLATEVADARAEAAKWKGYYREISEALAEADQERKDWRAEAARYREALEHYGAAENWNQHFDVSEGGEHGPWDIYCADPPDSNGYDVARAALAGGKPATEPPQATANEKE